jgi:hypothetical protein
MKPQIVRAEEVCISDHTPTYAVLTEPFQPEVSMLFLASILLDVLSDNTREGLDRIPKVYAGDAPTLSRKSYDYIDEYAPFVSFRPASLTSFH